MIKKEEKNYRRALSRLMLFVLFLGALYLVPQGVVAKELDCDQAKTQLAMNQCAERPLLEVEEKLALTLKALEKKGAKDKFFLKKLAASQKAWESYLKAQLELLFPKEDKQSAHGSVFPMCFSLAKKDLSLKRLKELQALLKEPIEGDVCASR